MVSEDTYALGMALIANQRDAAANYEERLAYMHQAVQNLTLTYNMLQARNAEIEEQLRQAKSERDWYRTSAGGYSDQYKKSSAQAKALEAALNVEQDKAVALQKSLADMSARMSEQQKRTLRMATMLMIKIAHADACQAQVQSLLREHPDTPLVQAPEGGKPPLQEMFEDVFVGKLKASKLTPEALRAVEGPGIKPRPFESMDLTTEDIESLGISCQLPR